MQHDSSLLCCKLGPRVPRGAAMAGQQPAQPHRRQQSLPRKLEQLQREGRFGAPPFTAVPPSGLLPIEGLVDEAGDLKSEGRGLAASKPAGSLLRQGTAGARGAARPTTHPRCPPNPYAGVVLLGFTRDGSHLISYTTQPVAAADAQDGYCLQLWRFQPGARCARLWSVPLFR